ncbi:hypothetical protein LTR97_010686 [Elasticomyces elasticus]|uniref:Xylanolytic transcriptional activator regulatory domain-containing protein n=1 Tax=Elasticomyces elasticus TaxID=574655 RepID=A0AAN7VLV0_9PEZI|nr:hypothetical protein LTR97_010686 [Elasticomyces elasticus]
MDLPCAVKRNGDRRKAGSRRHVETLEQRILDLESLQHRIMKTREQSELSGEDRSGVRSAGARSDGAASSDPSDPRTVASRVKHGHQLPPETLNLDPAETLPALDSDWTGILPSVELSSMFDNESSGQASSVLGPAPQYHALSPGMMQPHQLQQYQYHGDPYKTTDEANNVEIAVGTNTVHLKRKLLQSFFRYQPLWVTAVDEELFWEYRESRGSSMWYSNFLETVMLACAARLSSSSAVRSLGKQYSIQARADITRALEIPSAASLQGFLMLSEYEVSQGRDSMGWQLCVNKYLGMACRLLTDLGLHEPPGEAETILVKRARLHLLGACIALEGIWCIYLGRPSSIPRSVLRTATTLCEQFQCPGSTTLAAWVGLCGPMADICNVLSSSHPFDAEGKIQLAGLSVDLYSWFDKLPTDFVYDEPNAYAVLMQYCKAQILVQQASCCGEGSAEEHRVRIYDAAIRIIRLLLIHRQTQGNDYIRSVMLDTVNFALDTLVNQHLQHPDLIRFQEHDIQWLRMAVESMINMQARFPIVNRRLQSLAVAAKGTSLSPLFKAFDPHLLSACL